MVFEWLRSRVFEKSRADGLGVVVMACERVYMLELGESGILGYDKASRRGDVDVDAAIAGSLSVVKFPTC